MIFTIFDGAVGTVLSVSSIRRRSTAPPEPQKEEEEELFRELTEKEILALPISTESGHQVGWLGKVPHCQSKLMPKL